MFDLETREGWQALVDNGSAWQLEGSIGRQAMALIEAGQIMLGEKGHKDYWGSYVPGRHEVQPGTMGSPEYYEERRQDWPVKPGRLVDFEA